MNGKRNAPIKHGHYVGNRPSPEYYTWRSVKARCLNSKHPSYPKYGGSGIIIHPEWVNDFPAFLQSVGLRPSMAHTLDRIKSDLGYVPGNVRWATHHEQNRNRSDNRWISVGETTLCLEDWAKKLGCSPSSIRTRVKRGWTWERAVTTPPNPKFQSKNHVVSSLTTNPPRAFGVDEITIVLSEDPTAIRVYVGRRQIGAIQKIKAEAIADSPNVTLSIVFSDPKKSEMPSVFQKNINLYTELLRKFPWINVLPKLLI